MATYYVDPSAATNGSGTEGSPFNVLPANFSSAGYLNGDVFLFRAGTTYTPAWAGVDGDAFTVNRQIRFGRYGEGDKPIIGSNFTGSGNGKMFRFYTSGCLFQDIVIRNTSGVHPLYVQGGIADWFCDRCEFYNVRGDAVQFQNAITVGPSSALTGTVRIDACIFDGICNDALVVNCSGTIILSNNTARNVSLDTSNGDCLSVTGDCANLRVTGNNCDHTNKDTKQCFIQDGGTGTGYAYIADNVFNGYFGSDSTTHTAVYVTLPGLVTRNTIKSWRSGVFLNGPNIRVANNLIVQGGGSASTGAVWGASAGMVVENNTVVRIAGADSADAAIRNNTSNAGNKYRNNAIRGFTCGIRRGALAVETNNAFQDVVTPVVDASAAALSPHASDLLVDQGLTASYRLRKGSALTGAGAHLGYGMSCRDIERQQRPNPPSIGAYDVPRLTRR
jgi:hypothetical protein